MNEKTIKSLLIVVIATVVFWLVLQTATNKILSTMMLSKLVPFMKKKEGGLSRDPKDTASRYPAPWSYNGKTGYHTNKGITYETFKSNAARFGYAPTKDNFFKMPDSIWGKILRGVYMGSYPLEDINHLPRVQAVIITWAWGSGVGGAEKRLANFQRDEMEIEDSNITRTEIVENFNKHITPLNEKEWFNKLCDRRAEDFSKMRTFPTHGRGWLNRLEEFRKLFA